MSGKVPKYRKHSSRDRAFIEWQGKRRLLPGRFNSRESRDAYDDFLARNCGVSVVKPARPPIDGLTVMRLCSTYLATILEQENGDTRGAYQPNKYAIRPFAIEHGATLAAQFGPLALKRWQEQLAARGLSRAYIETSVSCIRNAFRWGVSEELIPASVWHALQAVRGLKPGKTPAKERRKRKPVPWSYVEAVLPCLSANVRAMVLLQWFTGARSGSICMARPSQFVRDGEFLLWRPRHKGESRGGELVLPLGPRAQSVLAPFLADSTDRWIFSPRTSNNNRRYGPRYYPTNYLNCLRTGLGKLNRQLAKTNTPALPYFSPHQLRHSKGHAVRAEYGLEATQAVLGHAQVATSEIYSQTRLDLAKQVARAHG